jgi:hypothetical protein
MEGRVTVVYDACESGSFLAALAPDAGENRVLITSTSPWESAYFVSQGSISFSNYFWSHIFNGLDLKSAFELAALAMGSPAELQHPLLDANGNGMGNEPADYSLCENVLIGNGSTTNADGPTIDGVSGHQSISGTSSASLEAFNVNDADGVGRVWAVLRPPDYYQGDSDNPVKELPAIDLLPVEGMPGNYTAVYDRFTQAGTWQVAIYARDRIGNTSLPMLTSVSVENPLYRKAVVIAAGTHMDPLWQAVEANAKKALEALLTQGYGTENTYLLSPAAIPGVDILPVLPSLSNTAYALSEWSSMDAQDATVYIIGKGGHEGITLNENEVLTPPALDNWLDTLQETLPGVVTVVIDCSLSGRYVSALAPPYGKTRIVLTSSGKGQPASFMNQGQVSFSQYFWNQIANGASVYDAFVLGKNAIEYQTLAEGVITAQIDDSGNGNANEKVDGRIARNHVIGTGATLAGDDPIIGAISPQETIADGEASATLWAGSVTSTGNIERVWANIKPPGYLFGNTQDPITSLPTIELIDAGDGIYRGDFTDFTTFGTYGVTVYAVDTDGNLSSPRETSFCYGVCSDLYEDDNSIQKATVLPIRSHQYHNFHDSGDEDWIKFYGLTGVTYLIRASVLDEFSDPVLELYDTDGQSLIVRQNTDGASHAVESLYWECQNDGVYYARVTNHDNHAFGPQTGYRLEVWVSMASSHKTIRGTVTDAISGKPVPNATIKSAFQDASAISTPGTGNYEMAHPEGNALLVLNADGYQPTVVTITVPYTENITENISMLPIGAYEDDYEDDDNATGATVLSIDDIPQPHTFHDHGDTDWIKFHGLAGKAYIIRAENLAYNCDVKLDIVDDAGDAVAPDPIDAGSYGTSEAYQWLCPNSGVYYLKLRQRNNSDYGEATAYEARINSTIIDPVLVRGNAVYELTDNFASGVTIILRDNSTDSAECSAISNSAGEFRLYCAPGSYAINTIVDGIEKEIGDVVIETDKIVQRNIGVAPLMGDINGDMRIDLSDAVSCMEALVGSGADAKVYPSGGVTAGGKLKLGDALYILQHLSGNR